MKPANGKWNFQRLLSWAESNKFAPASPFPSEQTESTFYKSVVRYGEHRYMFLSCWQFAEIRVVPRVFSLVLM